MTSIHGKMQMSISRKERAANTGLCVFAWVGMVSTKFPTSMSLTAVARPFLASSSSPAKRIGFVQFPVPFFLSFRLHKKVMALLILSLFLHSSCKLQFSLEQSTKCLLVISTPKGQSHSLDLCSLWFFLQ